MRKLFLIPLLFVVLVGGGLFLAPMFISVEKLKPQIEKAASEALGRDVRIASIPNLKVFPNPVVTVQNLTIANANGMNADYFATMGKADIGVKLIPLLGGNVEISRFVLTEPEINLQKKANGEVNWLLGSTEPALKANETEDSPSNAGIGPVKDISFGEVRLINGKITYQDDASKQLFVAEKTNIALKLSSLDAPLTAEGTMVFQGAPATLNTTISTPRSLIENTASKIDLQFSVEQNAVDAAINLTGGELNYNGNLSVNAPALQALLGTLGMNLDVKNGFEQLKIEGTIVGSATQMSFTNARFTFDEITGNGDMAFSWGGKRPKVSGKIDLSQLDLRPYLPEPDEAAKASRADKDAAFPPWPEDKIDFSFLQGVDTDLSARTNNIYLHGMSFGSSGLSIKINNGLLTAKLTELDLYGGGGSGVLSINSRARFPTVALKDLNLTGMNAQTFATEVLSLNRVRGIGGLTASLSAKGTSVADFMRTLSGDGKIAIEKGAMEGVDIGKIVRSASTLIQGFQGGSFDITALTSAISEARGPASETKFSELETLFSVSNGLLRSDNITMQGPFYRINGKGLVNLPNQSMDLSFLPTVFESLEDITGRKLKIPLQITGTFNEPKIGFDTSSLVRNLVEDRLKGVLSDKLGLEGNPDQSLEETLQDKARDELGRALGFGGRKDEADPDAAETPEDPSLEENLKGEALNLLFGGGKKED